MVPVVDLTPCYIYRPQLGRSLGEFPVQGEEGENENKVHELAE